MLKYHLLKSNVIFRVFVNTFFFLSQFKAGSGSRCSKKRISTAQMMQIRPDWHYWVGEIIFLQLSVGGGGGEGAGLTRLVAPIHTATQEI